MPRAAQSLDQLSPVSVYRLGHRDVPGAREMHAVESRQWRRRQTDQVWTEQLCRHVVAMLAVEPDPALVMGRLGMNASALYGRMSYDDQLRQDVEAVLTDHCAALGYDSASAPHGACGTAMGYKRGGRCRACRDAHRGTPA